MGITAVFTSRQWADHYEYVKQLDAVATAARKVVSGPLWDAHMRNLVEEIERLGSKEDPLLTRMYVLAEELDVLDNWQDRPE